MTEGDAVPGAQQCGWCGAELPDDGTGRRYCNATHKVKASRKRNGRVVGLSLQQQAERTHDRSGAAYPFTGAACETKSPFSSAEKAERAIRRRGGIGSAYPCGDHWHITRRPLNAPRNWRRAYKPQANDGTASGAPTHPGQPAPQPERSA